jgi:siroheme synthase
VIYMPGHDMQALKTRLMQSGVAAETPCAIVSSATNQSEQVHFTSVLNLGVSPRISAPRLIVVGEVVKLADPECLNRQFSQFTLSQEYGELNLGFTENGK